MRILVKSCWVKQLLSEKLIRSTTSGNYLNNFSDRLTTTHDSIVETIYDTFQTVKISHETFQIKIPSTPHGSGVCYTATAISFTQPK
jgi:hypothetical protein